MTRDQALLLAQGWIEAWNRKDVEAVLAHFDEAVCFTSPRAAAIVGSATVRGKGALRDYWNAAVAPIRTLRFALDHTVWDEERQELVIVYYGEIDGRGFRACELMRFGPAGLAVEGEAMYGAETAER